MQAVILAAGKGTRMQPITHTVPKPLLRINGQTIIEKIISELPKEIKEVIIVIGHLGEQIKNYLGNNYKDKKITYVKQTKQLGTAHALQICNKYLRQRFLVLMGDNVYSHKDIKKCLRNELCILAYQQTKKFTGNEVIMDENKHFVGLQKTESKMNCLVNTGLYILNKSFFDFSLVKLENKEEYGLPQTIVSIAKKYPIIVETTKKWVQINNHSDLAKAENNSKLKVKI